MAPPITKALPHSTFIHWCGYLNFSIRLVENKINYTACLKNSVKVLAAYIYKKLISRGVFLRAFVFHNTGI
jgi:predicted transglutaminase-like protease